MRTSLAAALLLLLAAAIRDARSAALPRPDKHGLYNASDNIAILDASNIKPTIYGSKNGWLVEFYSSWCGHCQRFAPVWRALAKDILVWKDIVTVAAIDCANENNTPTCREFEVTAYPTIKYIPMRARPESLGVELKRVKSIEGLKAHLINQLQKEQQEGRGQTWPNIIPYKTADTANLWKAVPPSTKHIFLIFEQADSTLGAEVIFDFHKTKEVHIRRVLSDNEALCITAKVQKFPSLVVLNRDGSQTKINVRTPTREFLVDAIQEFVGVKAEEQTPSPIESDSKSNQNSTDPPIPQVEDPILPDILYQVDLEKALQYSLYHEIPLSNIEKDKLVTLKEYLDLLEMLFPFGQRGRNFVAMIREKLQDKTSVEGSEFTDMLNLAETANRPVFGESLAWTGCKGSSEQYRGYPCGVWSMFHMLTVNYANSDIGSEEPARVLKVMHGYVKNFFGCWDCAQHFLKMAEQRKIFEVSSKDEAVLWLWRAHNEVNSRLSGDLTEDPVHRKVQYPLAKHCESCRLENGTWNEEEVLAYLKNKYSYVGMSHLESESGAPVVRSKTRRSFMVNDYAVKRKGGWDFTIFDISICVVLYVVSTVILMLVCIKFAMKKSYYRKKAFMPTFLAKA